MTAGSTLTTVGPTAAGGRRGRPTVTECAPGPRGRASMPAPGTTGSRSQASTRGQGKGCPHRSF